MKKAVLGLAVLGVYGIYSVGVRHQHPTIAKPASLANTNSNTGGNSNSGTNASANNTSSNNSNPSTPATQSSPGQYKDGTYKGSVADAYYGNVQVSVTISGGRIADVKFLQYPNTHSTSVYINQQAMPYLKQEAIQSQNSNVQIISGATFTSEAFIQSLQSALSKA